MVGLSCDLWGSSVLLPALAAHGRRGARAWTGVRQSNLYPQGTFVGVRNSKEVVGGVDVLPCAILALPFLTCLT